ncbi:hypothetical protein LZG04_11970 [Saccharothrix sp. S26]|uniref:hypothetical protein n=1 Tax=Saccharothrix sp. S26 TaxID=2907215 RepID=UPI001F3AB6FC|nr:hypothetical protein [Saccharothrix sp. S26]MCE6995514.1 hypothetical protein [Saccharothrix sp. S26]
MGTASISCLFTSFRLSGLIKCGAPGGCRTSTAAKQDSTTGLSWWDQPRERAIRVVARALAERARSVGGEVADLLDAFAQEAGYRRMIIAAVPQVPHQRGGLGEVDPLAPGAGPGRGR